VTAQPRGTLYGRPRPEPTVWLRLPGRPRPARPPRPPRPRGPGTLYGSRAYRWLRRRRRWEVITWAAVAVVAAGLVTYAVQTTRPAPAAVRFLPPPPAAAGPGCAFDDCQQLAPVGDPTAVRIPAIGVESTLEVLGREANGELTPPVAYDRAGWYGDGIVPGDIGPAVLAGHVDSRTGPGVFYDLVRLKAGDRVEVLRGGTWLAFRVTTVERYPKDEFPTERVYRPTPAAELRVITCGGAFDRDRGSYRDNVVVYAVAG